MTNDKSISLDEAKEQFKVLLNSLKSSSKADFAEFVFDHLLSNPNQIESDESEHGSECDDKQNGLLDDPVTLLNKISEEIKKIVPLNGMMPSENVNTSISVENSVTIDEFLYNEDDINQLVNNGKLQKYYCKDCGLKNTAPLTSISLSISKEALYHIFNNRLPVLNDKNVLNIGSRLGAVLYGAYLLTDAKEIIGVEMNEDLWKLQTDIVNKYKMNDRIEVLREYYDNIEYCVKSADVIIINNSFDLNVSKRKSIEIWKYLKEHIKKGAILITHPKLETTFKNLNTGIELTDWLTEYHYDENEVDILREAKSDCLVEKHVEEDLVTPDFGYYEVL